MALRQLTKRLLGPRLTPSIFTQTARTSQKATARPTDTILTKPVRESRYQVDSVFLHFDCFSTTVQYCQLIYWVHDFEGAIAAVLACPQPQEGATKGV